MTPRKGEYGLDAPYVPALMLLGSILLWVGAVNAAMHGDGVGVATMGLSLKGDERVLDVGRGRRRRS